MAEEANIVQELIVKEVTDITEPLLQDLAASDCELLLSDVEVVAKSIVTSWSESPESENEHKASLEAAE